MSSSSHTYIKRTENSKYLFLVLHIDITGAIMHKTSLSFAKSRISMGTRIVVYELISYGNKPNDYYQMESVTQYTVSIIEIGIRIGTPSYHK